MGTGDWVVFNMDLDGLHLLEGVKTLRSDCGFEELVKVGGLINFGDNEKFTRFERVEGPPVELFSTIPAPLGV